MPAIDDTPGAPIDSGGARSSNRSIIPIAIATFALLSLAVSITSDGFLEADGCTHYMYAKFAFSEPHYLINIWGRPICTALYAIPAQLGGRFAVRCTSLVLAIGVAFVSYAIARKQRIRPPELALVFTLAQPLVFLHSFAELTELPFALLLGLAFLVYLNKQWMWFAILASILPLSRPEGFGFILLAAIVLLRRDRFVWLLLLPIPVVVWSYVGWREYASPPAYPWYLWLLKNWPYAERSTYVSGSILHFVMLLPAVVSPLIFPAMLFGIWRALRSRQGSHRLIAVIPLMILVGHSVLYATGRMASSGEIRYMLIVAPFWAILAAIGWERLFAHRWGRFEIKAAFAAAVLPCSVNLIYQVLPLVHQDDWLRARGAVQWMRTSRFARTHPRVQAAHPGVYYFLDISPTDKYRSTEWRRDLIAHPRPGTVLLWDWVYGTHNSDRQRIVEPAEIIAAGWIPVRLPRIEDGWTNRDSTWLVFVSPEAAGEQPAR
ncbi:hypothetical protein BH09PLA1_BH09PLA1_19070 [soil metagenome]